MSVHQSDAVHQGLSEQDKDQLKSDGYLLLRQRIPQAALERVRRHLTICVDRWAAEQLAQGRVRDLCTDLPFESRFTALVEQVGKGIGQSLTWRRFAVGEAIHAMWQLPELLDIARSLFGEEIWAHGTWNCRPRFPGDSIQAVPWHQDAPYYYPDIAPSDGSICSCWLPLVSIGPDSGGIEVIPGTHTGGLRDSFRTGHNGLITAELTPAELDRAVPCYMEPGDALLFDQWTFHRSTDNRSDRIRWSFDLRFCDARSYRIRAEDPYGYLCHSASQPERVWSCRRWADRYGHAHHY